MATITSVSINHLLLPLCPVSQWFACKVSLIYLVFFVCLFVWVHSGATLNKRNFQNYTIVIPGSHRIGGAEPAVLTRFVSNMKMDVMVMYHIT